MTTLKVLIVDDSLVARRLISSALKEVDNIEVVGTAASGAAALSFLSSNIPDAMILDYEMPGMNGVETLMRIREDHKTLPVIIFSGHSEHGVKLTIDALAAGASDFVAKPSSDGPNLAQIVAEELLPKLYALCGVGQAHSLHPGVASKPRPVVAGVPAVAAGIVVIASSTGGPSALASLLSQLARDFPVPIAIVQHMPPVFTRSLAERLDAGSPLWIREAEEGMVVEPGSVCIAPGNFHMTVERDPRGAKIALNQGPPENSCRPSADVLFRSAAAQFGIASLGVVLTGMGNDGLEGSRAIVSAHGTVLAQDEASAVVASMPKAVAKAGLASAIASIDGLAFELIRRCASRPSLSRMRGARP